MQRVFVMYRLKPGVTMEDYRRWSLTVDQATTPHQKGVISFEVNEIKGAEKGESPYQVVEDICVESWEAWQETLKGQGMKQVVEEWESYGDGSTLVTVFGNKIE
jgi:hypothetical protein